MDNVSATKILDLPPEIILDIGGYLSLSDLNALVLTSPFFHYILSSLLYKRGANHVGKTSPLMWAVAKAYLDVVRRLLEKGADPHRQVNRGPTAFHKAVKCFNLRALDVLLQNTSAPSIRDGGDLTPLQRAVYPRRLVMLRKILNAWPGIYPGNKGGDRDADWEEAVRIAMKRNRVLAVRYLLEAASRTIPNPARRITPHTVLLAVLHGRHHMLRLLVDFGWNHWGACDDNEKTPLHAAAGNGDLEMMRFLLDYGSDVNAADGHGEVPLHYAVVARRRAAVKLLLEAGADVNSSSASGMTILHQCAEYGNAEIAGLLLYSGARVNVANQTRATPLHCAINSGDNALIEWLLYYGANVSAADNAGRTPLYLAAKQDNAHIVKRLISRSAHIDTGTDVNDGPLHAAAQQNASSVIQPLVDAGFAIDAGRRSPLYRATAVRAHDAMRELLRRGANVNFVNSAGKPVLLRALELETTFETRILLENGADISFLKVDGSSVLHEAVMHGVCFENMKLLMEYGADVHALGPDNRTLLHEAVKSFRLDLLDPFLAAGIPINARTSYGDTVLHTLVDNSRSIPEYNYIRKLLHSGADVNAQNKSGSTPLHKSVLCLKSEVHNILINAGADPLAKDNYGYTPLHKAASMGNKVLFRRLLKACVRDGLDYMTRDAFGQTPAHIAAAEGCVPILRMLEGQGQAVTAVDIGEDGYRGRPALNLAVSYNRTAAAKYLISRGADPFRPDVYGRSAIDWLVLDHSGHIRRVLERYVSEFTVTSPETQISILKASVAFLAKRLLSGDFRDWFKLEKCLLYLDNAPAATAAAALFVNEFDCEGCTTDLTLRDEWYVCKVCPMVSLCPDCMNLQSFREDSGDAANCIGHDFAELNLGDYPLPEGYNREETIVNEPRREFLEDLIRKYDS